MSPLAADQTELLRAVARHGVEFVVVGGVAARDRAACPCDRSLRRLASWARKHRLGEGLTVVVAAPGDILRSKEAAGREKDRAAVPQMRQDFIDAGAL